MTVLVPVLVPAQCRLAGRLTPVPLWSRTTIADRIAREEHGSTKIAVISGVGTRDYYRKLGYVLDGPYMSKPVTPMAGCGDGAAEKKAEEEEEDCEAY